MKILSSFNYLKLLPVLFFVIIAAFALFGPLQHSALAAAPCPVPTSNGQCTDDGSGNFHVDNRLDCPCIVANDIPFRIPNFSEILSFAIRMVFIGGGLAALFFLLLGAISWILSGGDKEKIGAAQQKIQAAILGVILIAVVLAIVVTLEQVIFAKKICLGISCPISIPALLKDK